MEEEPVVNAGGVMLVSKNAKICVNPNPKHKICAIPNAKPQHEPMEYRLCWVPKLFALAMYISCCLCSFHFRCVTNVNPVCSGIWANYIKGKRETQSNFT